MTDQQIGATERFAALVATMTADDDVAVGTPGSRGFGTDALTTGGKIFAMLAQDRLILKLPRARVDALVAAGRANPLTRGATAA